MPKIRRGWVVLGALAFASGSVAVGLWFALTYRPAFYRELTTSTADPGVRKDQAAQFVKDATRLRNVIANDPRWEAIFTDDEVNAWLAVDLAAHFADLIPEGVHDPRLKFEADRVVLAFKLDNGPVSSVVWAVVRVGVPIENQVALTIEKIRVGALPVPSGQLLDRLAEHARDHGMAVTWDKTGPEPVATIRYAASKSRPDVVLEALDIAQGRVRLSGRSKVDEVGQAARPSLPSRRVLQMTFPRRKVQKAPGVSSRQAGSPSIRSSPSRRSDESPSTASDASTRWSSHSIGS